MKVAKGKASDDDDDDDDRLTKDSFRINLWRAPTDNDRGWGMPKVCKVWKDATSYQDFPDGVKPSIKTTAIGDDRYLVEFTLKVTATNLPPIPRVGLTFTLPADYTHVAWHGLGPWENYSDRAKAALLGT